MDYTKLTKQELLDLLKEKEDNIFTCESCDKECQNLEQLVKEKEKALEDQIKARDEAITKSIEFENQCKSLKREQEHIEKLFKQEKENLQNSLKFMEEKFTELAKLFDEYIVAFKDQVKLSEVTSRNNNYVLQALELKIKKFNGSDSE